MAATECRATASLIVRYFCKMNTATIVAASKAGTSNLFKACILFDERLCRRTQDFLVHSGLALAHSNSPAILMYTGTGAPVFAPPAKAVAAAPPTSGNFSYMFASSRFVLDEDTLHSASHYAGTRMTRDEIRTILDADL